MSCQQLCVFVTLMHCVILLSSLFLIVICELAFLFYVVFNFSYSCSAIHLVAVSILVFIFDENLTFSDQISSLSKSCYSRIRELRCIRPYLDSKTASTIAASASVVHSKL